jgi:hypothetical protein
MDLRRPQLQSKSTMMFGVSIRSMLMVLFGLLGLIIGGQGYLAVSKIDAVNDSVADIAMTFISLVSAC